MHDIFYLTTRTLYPTDLHFYLNRYGKAKNAQCMFEFETTKSIFLTVHYTIEVKCKARLLLLFCFHVLSRSQFIYFYAHPLYL